MRFSGLFRTSFRRSTAFSGGCLAHCRAVSSFPTISALQGEEIRQKTAEITDDLIRPLNSQFLGPLGRSPDGTQPRPQMPFVFLLGNHSSGKSTFINHVLGKKVQTTGVAPTDDSFTVIAPGKQNLDQDGPALIGNPDAGFSGLRTFGEGLVNHVSLKMRDGLALDNTMLIDSPGMIDAPASGNSSTWDFGSSSRDRGYDFQAVTRWFAERADVVLLFFDPDKPGTTGETLAVLTSALTGLEHKLHIILNKVDQFERIHDFARAYGSLCWNLSKVIPRKDLPRIYTMYVPGPHPGSDGRGLSETLGDLDQARDDLIAEVYKAPERRVDNLITDLYDSARLLRTHLVVGEAARSAYSHRLWKWRAYVSSLFIIGNGAAAGVMTMTGMLPVAGGVCLAATAATVVAAFQMKSSLADSEKTLLSESGLDEIFQHEHIVEMAEGDEFLKTLWERKVRAQLQVAMKTVGIQNYESISNSRIRALNNVIDYEVPKLRKMSDPFG